MDWQQDSLYVHEPVVNQDGSWKTHLNKHMMLFFCCFQKHAILMDTSQLQKERYCLPAVHIYIYMRIFYYYYYIYIYMHIWCVFHLLVLASSNHATVDLACFPPHFGRLFWWKLFLLLGVTTRKVPARPFQGTIWKENWSSSHRCSGNHDT